MRPGSLRKIVLLLAAALACVFLGIVALAVVIPAAVAVLVATGLRRTILALRRIDRRLGRRSGPARPVA